MGTESTQFSEESLMNEVASSLGLPLTLGSPRPSVLLSIPSRMDLPKPAWPGRSPCWEPGGTSVIGQACPHVFSQITSSVAFPAVQLDLGVETESA